MWILVTKAKLEESIVKLWAKIKQTFVTQSYAEANYATQSYVEEALQNVENDHEIANNSSMGKLVLTVTENGVEKQYAIDRQPVEAPAAPTLPDSATFTGTTTIQITNIPDGASVRWFSTGLTPNATTGNSATSITLAQVNTGDSKSKTYTVKLVAVKFGLVSIMVERTYTINRQLAAPTISNPTGDKYDSSRNVTITNNAVGGVRGTLKYKIGSGSWVTPTLTNNAVTINATGSVTAKVELENWESNEATKTVTVGAKKCYIGKASDISIEANITALSNSYKKDTFTVGETLATIDFGTSGNYVWICIPNTAARNLGMKSGGFDVKLINLQKHDINHVDEEVISDAGKVIGSYRVWRTFNKLVGTYDFNFVS